MNKVYSIKFELKPPICDICKEEITFNTAHCTIGWRMEDNTRLYHSYHMKCWEDWKDKNVQPIR